MTNQSTNPLTEQQLDDIEARANTRRTALSGWINCYSPLSEQKALENAEAVLEEDVPLLVTEVRRLRAEADDLRGEIAKLIRWHREDETAAARMRATITRLRGRQLTASEYNAAWHAVEGAAKAEGADPGTVLHAALDRLGIEWRTAARPAAVAVVGTGEQQPAACGKCRTPFDPADTRHDGHARSGITSFCRRCVDACHENSDAFHVCAVCREGGE